MPKSHFHQANIFNVLFLVSCFGTHIRNSQTEIILLHKLNANDLIKFIVTIACVAGVQRGGRGRNRKKRLSLSHLSACHPGYRKHLFVIWVISNHFTLA